MGPYDILRVVENVWRNTDDYIKIGIGVVITALLIHWYLRLD